MTPEEKALLENTYQIAKENNELLRGIQRRGRWSLGLRVGYWAIIIGLSVGALYFIQPYVDMLKGLTGGSSSTNSTDYSATIQDLLR